MRKAINYDIDTKKYEKYTKKHSPTAYLQLRKFLKSNGFEHRQGSGYVSIENITNSDVIMLIRNMTLKFDWLAYCVEHIDVTNIGKQHSLIDYINKAEADRKLNDINDIEI